MGNMSLLVVFLLYTHHPIGKWPCSKFRISMVRLTVFDNIGQLWGMCDYL